MMRSQLIFSASRDCIILTVVVSLSAGLVACSGLSQAESTPTPSPSVVQPTSTIVALGRLTPNGEVIKLSVPNAQDSRVNQILVEEGDWVKAGQVIAVLQGSDRRQRDLEEALKNVDYYQALLDRAKAGDAKDAEITAQQANIGRLEAQLRTETLERQAAIASVEAELRQAERNYERYQMLYAEGAAQLIERDQAQEAYETAQANLAQRQAQLDNTLQTLQQQITQERENLARLREVRPVDIRVAQAELERAMIAVEQRRADLEDTQVRVPVDGQILRINTRVGEQVNTQEGIVELGRTDEMFAIAEVYETEITRVRVGQPVTLISEYGGFNGEVQGTVDHIGLQVGTRQLSSNSSDPTTDENTRVVEVKIRINPEDNNKVANLTNMQVRATIHLDRS